MDITGIREIRKRIDPENFRSIHGCYVNVAKEIVAKFEIPIPDMTAEEKEMYSKVLKKALSGKQDKNLVDVEVTNKAVQEALFSLSKSRLENEDLRDGLYDQIIENLETDRNYCIIAASDTYDLKDEESEFTYFICAICPIKETKAELRYMPDPEQFRVDSTGSIMSNPSLGFMYPAFVDNGADIFSSVYYFGKDPHMELVEGLFKADPPKTAEMMKEEFHEALAEALDDDYDLDMAAVIYSDVISNMEDEVDTTIDSILESIQKRDIPEDKAEKLQSILGEDYICDPENLVNKKYEIKTPETTITTDPENALRIKIKEIDGRTYILIPAGESISVNGYNVSPKRD